MTKAKVPIKKRIFTAPTTGEEIEIERPEISILVSGLVGAMEKYDITVEKYINSDQEYQNLCIEAMVQGSLGYWAEKGLMKISRKQRKRYRKKLKHACLSIKDGQEIWDEVIHDKAKMDMNILITYIIPSYEADKMPLWIFMIGKLGSEDLGEKPMEKFFEIVGRLRGN